MNKDLGIIIQARIGSSRLPGKILKELNGKPLLWHVVERCKSSKSVNKVVVATTTEKDDDLIEKMCRDYNIPFFRGDQNNVLSRYYGAAKKFKFKTIGRITSDCPLIDPAAINKCFSDFKKQNCDYISNVVPGKRTYPIGLSVEIFSLQALKKAFKEASLGYEKEHVTPYIWENKGKKFKLGRIVTAPASLIRNYRLTVDYPEDFRLINTIYSKFPNHKIIPIRKAIKFLDDHPKIAAINAKSEQKYHSHAPINLLRDKIKNDK